MQVKKVTKALLLALTSYILISPIYAVHTETEIAPQSVTNNSNQDLFLSLKMIKEAESTHSASLKTIRGKREKKNFLLSARNKILETVKDYTAENTSLEESIARFIRESCQIQVSASDVILVKPLHKKHDGVYFIKDHDIAVKIFRLLDKGKYKGTCNFFHELGAIDFLRSQYPKESNPISPLAVGKVHVNKPQPFLFAPEKTLHLMLAETKAQGIGLDHILHNYGKNIDKNSNEERREICNKALYQLGRALAEFQGTHCSEAPSSRKIKFIEPKETTLKERLRFLSKKAADPNYAKALDGLSIHSLEKIFTSLLEDYKNAPFYLTLEHRDAHTGNFIYDVDTNKIAIIDLARVFRPLDLHDTPSGVYFRDIVRVIDFTEESLFHYKIEKKIVKQFEESFLEGYRSCMQTCLPIKAHSDFAVNYQRLARFTWLIEKYKPNQEPSLYLLYLKSRFEELIENKSAQS